MRCFRATSLLCSWLAYSTACCASLIPLKVSSKISPPVTQTTDYHLMWMVLAEDGDGDIVAEYDFQTKAYFVTWGDLARFDPHYSGPADYVVVLFDANGLRGMGTYGAGTIGLQVDDRPFRIYLPEFTLTDGGSLIAFYVAADGSSYYANYSRGPSAGTGVVRDLLRQACQLTPEEAFIPECLAAENPNSPHAVRIVGQGSSYTYNNIEDAIWDSQRNDSVVVTPGTYREHNIVMKEGVNLVSFAKHAAIIDGEGHPWVLHMNSLASVRGFVITNGYYGICSFFGFPGDFCIVDCLVSDNRGIGIIAVEGAYVRIQRTDVSRNDRGGISIHSGEVLGGTIHDNGGQGGAYVRGTGRFSGVAITGNSWYGVEGGERLVLESCLVAGNRVGVAGGFSGPNRAVNCTIVTNWEIGLDALGWGGDSTVLNCIFRGNGGYGLWGVPRSSVSYSVLQEDYWGCGTESTNICADPAFVDPARGDWHLRLDSPCIDAGTTETEALPERDADGLPRVLFGGKAFRADIGAYEAHVTKIVGLGPADQGQSIQLAWSSLEAKSYAVYFSDDLRAWYIAADAVLSQGNIATCWTDKGPLRMPGSSVAVLKRFYRVAELP